MEDSEQELSPAARQETPEPVEDSGAKQSIPSMIDESSEGVDDAPVSQPKRDPLAGGMGMGAMGMGGMGMAAHLAGATTGQKLGGFETKKKESPDPEASPEAEQPMAVSKPKPRRPPQDEEIDFAESLDSLPDEEEYSPQKSTGKRSSADLEFERVADSPKQPREAVKQP